MTSSPPPPSAVAAGKAGDDDADERNNPVDNNLNASCDCVDDAHDTCADGAEEVRDLMKVFVS